MDEFKKEALREIGNMGASHAANSLSQMLGVKVEIQVPELDTLPVGKLREVVGWRGDVIGVHSKFLKDLSGKMVLLLSLIDARTLGRILTGEMAESRGSGEPRDMEVSAVQEVGNIMISSFANAMSDFLGFKIMLTPSTLVKGPLPSIIETVFNEAASDAVFFSTSFSASTGRVQGYLILLPDLGASEKIFAAIKSKYGLG